MLLCYRSLAYFILQPLRQVEWFYTQRALFQNVTSANPEMEFGKELLINMSIYIWEKLFSKMKSVNLALALQAHFIGMVLSVFWKRAHHILLKVLLTIIKQKVAYIYI